jgi:hypothetical protein
MVLTASALRGWIAARRAAEARERRERQAHPLPPEEAWEQGLALIAFAARRHGWPLPDDPRAAAEDELGYDRWRRLRAAWRQTGGAGD